MILVHGFMKLTQGKRQARRPMDACATPDYRELGTNTYPYRCM